MADNKRKVALVLGGGGARGLAHIGVLEVLEEHHISIDLVVGTSIGAFVGGFYAARISVDEMERVAKAVDRIMVARMLAPNFSTGGFVDTGRIRKFLIDFIGDSKIEQLDVPFAAVAADLNTGEARVLTQGSLVEAIMASTAIPALFPAVSYDGGYLIDGGLVEPLPVRAARTLGARIIVAVNVAAKPGKLKQNKRPRGEHAAARLNKTVSMLRSRLLREENQGQTSLNDQNDANALSPSAIKTFMQSVSIVENNLIAHQLRDTSPDILISPDIHEFGILEFHRGKELIACGVKAALKALPAIQAVYEMDSNKR